MSNKIDTRIERCIIPDPEHFTVIREDENGCPSCCLKIRINQGALGLVSSTFEYVMTESWADDVNGGGLNLTSVTPTYTNATGNWQTSYVIFQVFINGVRLSLSEYTIASGVFQLVAPTVISENDNLMIDTLSMSTI